MAKRRKKKVPKGIHPIVIKYRARLDTAWRKAVYEAGGGVCFITGEAKNVNAHHIIDRRCYSSRWNVDNGLLLSPLNHKWSPNKGIHNNPLFVLHQLQLYDNDRWDRIIDLALYAKTLHEMTEKEQKELVIEVLRELRPDLYKKDFKKAQK